jgi:signal transduction histidine kinase/predicted RNA-binding protein with RPS1 domain/DNA-binding NarL/FixJ family response regulator
MRTYRNGDPVRAIVEDVYPFGVFVRLEDDTRAYIRCRELTLAGDIDPRTIVSPGSLLTAVVRKQAESDRIMELSVRDSLPDPWEGFLKRTRVGDVVKGTVKNLYADRVYVEIVPGVSGFISLADLAAWTVEHPEDLLWTGDHVEAVILNINKSRKKIQLSIRQRIEQLSQARIYLEQLRSRQGEDQATVPLGDRPTVIEKEADAAPQNLALSVLVVEDTPEVREPLLYWLDNHGCRTAGADRVAQAVETYREGRFDAALVDLDLPVTNGLAFIRKLHEQNARLTVAVMSDPELIARSMDELQDLGVAAVFPKPLDLDEILQFLENLSNGEQIQTPVDIDNRKAAEVLEPYQELSEIMRSNHPITERFNQGLDKLLEETRVEKAIVFRLDPVSGQISIVASRGAIPLHEEHTYGLVNSPVHDVIHREMPVWENHMDGERQRRFEKLLALLDFESCIGLPVAAGGKTEHALFIFRREAEFARYHLRSTVGMALFFSIALEDQLLNERVRALSGLFLSGQLSASFAHEIYNKVSGLDLYLRNLKSDMARVEDPADATFDPNQLHLTVESTMKLSEGLKQTVKEFRRLMEVRRGDRADLNEVIHQVLLQMQPQASRAGIHMVFEPVPDLPLVAGSSLGLLQVSLNLVLNAVQQMEKSKLRQRELAITCRAEDGKVITRFQDAGPGIHRSLWDKIFNLGFTTRPGGSGIGLFIARSLIESMGGNILVEESLIPLGTVFRLELRCHEDAPAGGDS